MVMPEYSFKCKKCNTISKFEFRLRDVAPIKHNAIMQECKKCKNDLRWSDIQIEFAGSINMNASSMGIHTKKYGNKAGGPVGMMGGKEVGRAKT
jgi:predicted nucleic acid-binding Zn ribbon protein